MKISTQSYIPEKGSICCTSFPKPEIGDQNNISDMPFVNSLEGQILTIGSAIILRLLTYVDDYSTLRIQENK